MSAGSTHFGRYVSVGNAGQYCRDGRALPFDPGTVSGRTIIDGSIGKPVCERLRNARTVVVGVHGQRPDAGRGYGESRANVQQNGFHSVLTVSSSVRRRTLWNGA